MNRRFQFGMRENTASPRQHASRLERSIKSDSNHLEERNIQTNAHAQAARQRAATDGGRQDEIGFSTRESERRHSGMSVHTFEPLINSPEAAKLLGNIHVKTLLRYARRGILPGYRVGGHWYFRASELDEWLRSQINSSCHPCR